MILAALVGTTIAPWQHFYLQAAVVEKRVGPRQYPTTRNDVIVGSLSCMLIVFFIIVCTAATLYVQGIARCSGCGDGGDCVTSAGRQTGELALFDRALECFVVRRVDSAAFNVLCGCEALGFESGIDRKFGEAKIFYTLYTSLIFLGHSWCLRWGSLRVRFCFGRRC